MNRRVSAILLLSVSAFLTLNAASSDWSDDWAIYRRDDYGFSFSYPAHWHLFENVRTPYAQRKLPAVLSLCVTASAVKTLECDAELYVIPTEKFTPPSDTFLEWPAIAEAPGSSGSAWGKPFSVFYSTRPPVDSVENTYVVQNGFVFLWVHGDLYGQGETVKTMADSFQFFLPTQTSR